MGTYRIYFLDRDGHISRPPKLIEAADDDEASQKARQYIDGKDVEVWRGEVRVAQFPREEEDAFRKRTDH